MSRDQLNQLINAVERHPKLRKEIKDCETQSKFIEIALKYGFKITKIDLQEDQWLDKCNSWFIKSKINPIKKI